MIAHGLIVVKEMIHTHTHVITRNDVCDYQNTYVKTKSWLNYLVNTAFEGCSCFLHYWYMLCVQLMESSVMFSQ